MTHTSFSTKPELFFCLCAPIGVNLDRVTDALSAQLSIYGYETRIIKLTEMLSVLDPKLPSTFKTLFDRYDRRIKSANRIRKATSDAVMAATSLFMIRSERATISGKESKAANGVAYIIKQLKRPEEIALFRKIYGEHVFQLSAYADEASRRVTLAQEMRDFDPASTRISGFEGKALQLIRRDEREDIESGQQLQDVFPLADVFIDASTPDATKAEINRFIDLIFGYNFYSPSRQEYGMFLAKAASFRSADLSRQVGAAACSEAGETLVMGCNEVPSPYGGSYWEGDAGDARDFKVGSDTNDEFRHRLLGDILQSLSEINLLSPGYALPSREFISRIKKEKKRDFKKTLLLMDLVEYGRMLHAEMNAITDAARRGVRLDGSTLYCTTFPCHLCAKHIIASGIKRVVYIEPYPKGYTQELYRDAIFVGRCEEPVPGRVVFEPFIGIAPFRYRDFFEKGRRKDDVGKAKEWQRGAPYPSIVTVKDSYISDEEVNLLALMVLFAKAKLLLPDSYKKRVRSIARKRSAG
jgi:deoxycytidylate deaminase